MNTQIIRPPTPIKAGIMMIWPTDTAPSGWLLCFGQAISRAGYSGLFAAIGATFGVGDGSTTFNLPDYRGRVPLGKDNMGGASANRVTNAQADAIGGAEGAENNSLTEAQMPAHVHTGPDHLHTGPDHLHTITNHVHTGPSHVHTGPDHLHTITNHVHTGPSHVHTGPAHTHGIKANDEIGSAADIFARSVISGESTDHSQSDGTGNTGAGGTGDTGSAGAGNTGSNGTGNTGSSGTGNTGSAGAGNTGSNGTGNTGSSGTGNTGSKGSGGAHNNMSPYLTLNYIIKI